MFRVWGGGIYESEDFYELCASLEIAVWQDFMFAGAMYPATDYYITLITEEVWQQILRLGKYKCTELWCGNYEIDEAWHNWGWQKQYSLSATDSTFIRQEYQSIFHKL
jgi:Beta-galactosidase/beta-glucuronidase